MQTACQSQLRALLAISVAAEPCRPGASVPYEPMFDSKKNITARLTDAADLLIDIATLGEYGLEPVGRTAPSCETRHRRPAPTGASRTRRAGSLTPSRSPRPSRIEGPFLLRP